MEGDATGFAFICMLGYGAFALGSDSVTFNWKIALGIIVVALVLDLIMEKL